MPFFPSLPDDAGARHILTLNPAAGRALIEFHTAALRTDSQLTARDKELIAAFVSGLNACQYCFGVHTETAKACGVDESLIEALLVDFESAPVDARLRPMLEYARVLTLTPTKATQRHVDAIFAVGWTERDLHDAILTVCLFNFMNRLLEGHGVKGSADVYAARGQALRDLGYSPLLALLSQGAAPGTAHTQPVEQHGPNEHAPRPPSR
ncbi:MAG: peroxidase-related enzyme [Rubrivivax sp.]|nr:peroxidase-related enzyme [Rubrivivax sp.]